MLDPIIESPIVLTLICGLLAIAVVSLGFRTPYINRLAMPARFPLRAFTRTTLIAFLLLINATSLGLAHRLPVGSTLIAIGFLMLLFLPADEATDGSTSSR